MINTKFVEGILDFSNMKKGGAKRGGSVLLAPMNKRSDHKKGENSVISTLGSRIWKGGHRGVHKKGVRKGEQCSRILVLIIYNMLRSSEANFWGEIRIFSYSHQTISNIRSCTPFASPFLKFSFFKHILPQVLPESKIKFIRWLLAEICYQEL